MESVENVDLVAASEGEGKQGESEYNKPKPAARCYTTPACMARP